MTMKHLQLVGVLVFLFALGFWIFLGVRLMHVVQDIKPQTIQIR